MLALNWIFGGAVRRVDIELSDDLSDEELARLERQAIQSETQARERTQAVADTVRTVKPWLSTDTPPLPADLQQLIPPSGYVHDYMNWAYPMTDAPAEYHIAGAMTALSIATGNQMFIQSGPLKLFANLWHVII